MIMMGVLIGLNYLLGIKLDIKFKRQHEKILVFSVKGKASHDSQRRITMTGLNLAESTMV